MSVSKLSEEQVQDALRAVVDPEVGMNIVDLGLVYGIEVTEDHIYVVMTMTTPACPMSTYITDSVRHTLRALAPGMEDIQVHLVWDPPWHPGLMSEGAKTTFGW